MNKSTSSLVAGILIGAVVATGGFSLFLSGQKSSTDADSAKVVLKLGHALDTNHPVHKGMEFMKERLEELSDGSVTMNIYPGSVLGSPQMTGFGVELETLRSPMSKCPDTRQHPGHIEKGIVLRDSTIVEDTVNLALWGGEVLNPGAALVPDTNKHVTVRVECNATPGHHIARGRIGFQRWLPDHLFVRPTVALYASTAEFDHGYRAL